MRRIPGWTLIGTLALVACGGSADKKIDVAARDSSGVQVLDHPAGALSMASIYEVGKPVHTWGGSGADSMHDVTTMRNAVFTGNGRFVVLDGRANRLIQFDSTGAVLATYGKRGDGPGEMKSPSQPRLSPDGNIWLMDLPAKVIRVSADLKPVGEDTIGPKDPVVANVLLLLGKDAIATENAPQKADSADGRIHRSMQYLIRERRQKVDTLTSWPGNEWFAEATKQDGQQLLMGQSVRFGRTTVARAWGNQIVVGTADGWSLEVRDTTGTVKKRIVLHEPGRAVDAALRDSVKARDLRQVELMRGADEEMKASARAAVSQQRFADSVAPYDDAIEGRDGTLWVAETVVQTDSLRWYAVFDKDGHLTRRVQLPAKNRIVAVDGDLVLVRRLDANNVGYFDLARLSRKK